MNNNMNMDDFNMDNNVDVDLDQYNEYNDDYNNDDHKVMQKYSYCDCGKCLHCIGDDDFVDVDMDMEYDNSYDDYCDF
jgi:hypothetical protein